ncbi:hypothetical protein ACODT4_44570 [Streptomyces sp. 2.9]|uniref:hypothetical protein n=1 Tax=Streptomyces tritrimontium TaxID=3406573 RepID=UPI003BB7C264
MGKVFKRTENGESTLLSLKEGQAEIGRLREAYALGEISELFASGTGAIYTNADGLRIRLFLTDAPPPEWAVDGHRPV